MLGGVVNKKADQQQTVTMNSIVWETNPVTPVRLYNKSQPTLGYTLVYPGKYELCSLQRSRSMKR
jgi:hypothetical protein